MSPSGQPNTPLLILARARQIGEIPQIIDDNEILACLDIQIVILHFLLVDLQYWKTFEYERLCASYCKTV